MLIISEIAAKTGMLMLLGEINSKFLADRTIGRAFGTMCRLSVCLSVCLGRCRISTSGFASTTPRWLFFALCIVAKWYVLAKNCLKE